MIYNKLILNSKFGSWKLDDVSRTAKFELTPNSVSIYFRVASSKNFVKTTPKLKRTMQVQKIATSNLNSHRILFLCIKAIYIKQNVAYKIGYRIVYMGETFKSVSGSLFLNSA